MCCRLYSLHYVFNTHKNPCRRGFRVPFYRQDHRGSARGHIWAEAAETRATAAAACFSLCPQGLHTSCWQGRGARTIFLSFESIFILL